MTFRDLIQTNESNPIGKTAKEFIKLIRKMKRGEAGDMLKNIEAAFKYKELNAAEFDEVTAELGRRQNFLGESLSENEIKFEALSVMKEIHSQLAELSFVDVIAVMREENPLRKDVTVLEKELNDLTNKVGQFVTDNLADAVDMEAADIEDVEKEKEEASDQEAKNAAAAAKAIVDGKSPKEEEK